MNLLRYKTVDTIWDSGTYCFTVHVTESWELTSICKHLANTPWLLFGVKWVSFINETFHFSFSETQTSKSSAFTRSWVQWAAERPRKPRCKPFWFKVIFLFDSLSLVFPCISLPNCLFPLVAGISEFEQCDKWLPTLSPGCLPSTGL